MMDRTEDGRRLKILVVVDEEYTRECLCIEVERSITSVGVVTALEGLLFADLGEPAHIRSDDGPEFVAHTVMRWLRMSGVKTLYIDPGSPWQSAC